MVLCVVLGSVGNAPARATFMTLDGEVAVLSDYRGQGYWLVVMIWSYDCPVCQREVGEFQALHARGQENNIRVLGLSLDGEAGAMMAWAFVAEYNLDFINLVGEPSEVADFYTQESGQPFRGTPSLLIFSHPIGQSAYPSPSASSSHVATEPPALPLAATVASPPFEVIVMEPL